MAELRVKGTGTLKLFENDNTSNVTIASPASLTGDRTVTLPDANVTLASGTMLATDGSGASLTALNASELGSGTVPAARLSGTGKVGQVVSTTLTTTFSISASDFTDITGLSLSITPVATSSKVWISTYLSWAENDGNFKGWARFVRDSTAIGIGTGSMGSRIPSSFPLGASFNLGTGDQMSVSSGLFLDSPSTTSATTYKIQGYGTGGYSLFINRTGDDDDDANTGRFASTITAMEILA